MEIEGKLILDLGETGGVSKAGNNWRKHEYVIETLGQYPKKVKFHVFGDRCATLKFEPMKTYRLQVDVESREFNGRWYTDLNCYNMTEVGASDAPAVNDFGNAGYQAPAQDFPGQQGFGQQNSFQPADNDSTDDLPF